MEERKVTELEKLVNEKKGGSRGSASSNGYLSALVEQKKNEQKMATPYADAVKSGAGAQNLYATVAKKMQGQSTMQTPYADAAAQIKQSGTNNNFLHGIAGIFEKAAAGAKEGLRTGVNEMGYRAQAANPLNAADDAYYKAMWEQTTGRKTGVEIPTDTRTQQQKDLDEYMGVADLKNDSARAMQRAAEKEYERLDKEGVKTAFKRDNTYQERVDQRYADLGPKWQQAMSIAGSVGNQALPMIGRLVGTALLGEKGGEAFQSLLFFNQASGAAIEEALADGAKWDEALTYGTVIGSIEAATEAAGDMANKMTIKAAGKYLPKEQFTKALIGTLTSNKSLRTVLSLIGQMHGEGLEEVASDLVSPFAKSIYNGKTLGENWMDDVTIQRLWESYLGGAISGGILAGLGGALQGQFRAQNQNYANETVNAKLEEARASMKENGLFNSETREKIIDAGTELGALEAQQQTAAQDAREHMQMIREMQRALRGDVGARTRLSSAQEGTYASQTQNAPAGVQRAQNEVINTPAAAINIQEGMNNGQSTYQGRENGAYDLRTGGQAAAEGRAQAFPGGRGEIPGGVGQSTQADLRQVTPAQLGIKNGDMEAVTVVDAQQLGGEAKSAYDTVTRQGMEPIAIRGAIQVGNGYANAYTESGKVYFRVDAVDSSGNAISPEALVHHELFHNYISEEGLRASAEVIRESMTAEEYDSMYEAYRDAYASIYDFENMSVEEIERILREEIAADAYAGLNFFSEDAQVQEAVRTEAERNAPAQRAEAQRKTTGPPGRATAAGINARTADSSTLRRAEALEKSGTDNETIRQETGWYRGMDGQWRFEIDDSKIKLWYEATVENGRETIPNYTTLENLIDAPELFTAYPDMRNMDVNFQSMENGVNGSYNRQYNSIDLSRTLKSSQRDLLNTLTHEIQHAVQDREGFTKGANPAYWNRQLENGFDGRTTSQKSRSAQLAEKYNQLKGADPQLMKAAEELEAMAPDVPRGEVDWDTLEQITPDPPEWERYDAKRDEIFEKYGDRAYEYMDTVSRVKAIQGESGRTPTQLYYDTAGEIEARDTASRRRMTAEERKNTPPNLGDADTVFADGSNVSMEIDANSDAEILHLKDQLRAAENRLAAMSPVATVETKGDFPTRLSDRRNKVLQMLNANKTVDRQNFGKIRLDDGSIRKGIKYVRNAADLAAFEAVPAVMKKGIQINHHEQHKGGKVSSTQNVESWTFAAPVTMNGRTGNLAVVVQKTKDLSYKAHKMLTPDGKAFVLDGPGTIIEAESRPNINETGNGLRNVTTDSASTSSIRSTSGNSQEKSSGRASTEVNPDNTATQRLKERQFELIQKNHPKEDWDYQTWINSVDDVKTYQEAVDYDKAGTPDFDDGDIDRALKTGKVRVYSSHRIRIGTFVTPSRMEAESYAGSTNVYYKNVPLTDVAWIDSLQGQYAPTATEKTGRASTEVSGINNRTAAELKREYDRRTKEYQEATRRDDPSFPYRAEAAWLRTAEQRIAELNDGKRRRRTVGNTKRDIMELFSTDRANRTDVERILNRNIGEMMAEGEIRGDALDTLVNELLQTGTVVSSSKNSSWIDETYENIRKDLKGDKLYVSKDTWRDFSKDEARELRERAKAAGITLADNRRYSAPDVRNMELAEKYGEEIFPTDISASDMLRNIVYCAEQGANEKQTLADRLWDEARQEGLGAAREEAYSRMVNDLRDKTEVILREFAEDNHLKLKEQTKAEAKSVSYFDTKKAPVKEYSRRKGDYRPINNLGEYTREIVEMESALETKDAYIIEQGENRFRVKIEEDSGRFYASVYRNGEMIASSSAANRGRLPHWAATEIRKNIGEQISFSPALENRGESYNADLKAAEEAGYPVFEKKNGEKVQTVPFWTWVRNKERGNYGIVIAQTNKTDSDGNQIVEVYYYNKQKDTGKVVGESTETVYAVDGKYSDPNEVEKSAARMKDEESEAMRAEEREALWRETQKGSPFEAQPNATTDTRERVTKPTSAGVERLFQQLISKGKTEVSTQGEAGIRKYTAKMNTNGVEYWVDISDGQQDVQRFREFEKEKAAQLAAEWIDKEANRAYTAANEKRAEARQTELSQEENARIAELFGNTEELKAAEVAEEAPSPAETAESRVADEIVKAEKSFRENLADVTHGAMRMFVNAGETVRRIAKQTKNKSLEGYYFNAGAYSQRAGNWITKGGSRTDISGHKTGESLMDILGDIMKTPEKYKKFQLMLLHRNNVDRMRYDNKEEIRDLTRCVTTIEDLYPKLRGLDNDYIYQTAVPGDKRDMLTREWKETVLEEMLAGEMPEIADISEAAQMLIFTRQKISEAKKNGLKPVFGYEVTAYDSQVEAERLLKANPEFDALAKKVYAYFDDLLQYRIDAGLDTQKHVNAMKKRYPNYVPTMRVEGTKGKAARRARRNGGIVVSNAIGRAIGGDAVIMPLHTAMSRKTVAVMKNAGLNQFGEQLVQSWNKDRSIPGVEKVEMADYSSTDQYVDSEELYVPITNNTFSVLRGNDRYNITMDEGLAQAMNAFQPDKYANSDVAKMLKKGNDLFKALCTGYNPIFMVRNFVRDAQDAAFYSTDSATWAKMFPSAWKQIVTNGEIWQQYKALGGSYSSMLDYTTGLVKEPTSAAGKLVAKYETLGQAIEAAPRLAEFMTILANKGGSKTTNGVKTGKFTQSDLMEAMLGAADITTNFARGGTVTKMLNKYLVPFLNPSVQGADKFVRNITDRKGFKAWASLAIKAAALGILPELLNGLLYRDDDEWDDIPDQTKSNYYLFKLGDGYWLKIPRGRTLAVFSAGATYAQEKAKGNAPKFSDVIEVVKSNVAPTDIFNQNIATAWTQTKLFNPDNPGTTWYGGNIESDRLQNYRPGERYDEKTDELSKLLGKTFNLSPKKINYLLDQYSGVIGDLLLPWLTPSATASSPALAPLKQAFMLDSTSTNKTTGEYYDLLDDLKYDKNDGDVGAEITRKYVSHAGDEVNDYYAQIREIQNDKELTKAEKNRLVRALKKQLVERQKEIIAKAEPYREAVNKYLKAHPELATDNDAAIAEYAEQYEITEDQAESRMDAIVYREANREVFGAEYALRTYNADVYDKARAAYAKGVSYDTYYDYYFATKEMHADKDENGKSISGSKKAKVVEYINSLDIQPEQKDALYIAAGYTEKSARYQKWNGGSGGSGGSGKSSKKTKLKAPTPKTGKIVIPGATAKSSGNVIADFTQTSSGTDIQKAVTQAKRKALKVGNRTVYVEEGSPIDYFLKYGKLPSVK